MKVVLGKSFYIFSYLLAQELFKSLRDAEADGGPRPASVLNLMRKISPKKSKCSCGQYVGSDFRYCPHCREENSEYDKDKADLLRSGHRKGWRAAPEPAISAEAEAAGEDASEPGLLGQLDDLMKHLRQRNKRKRNEEDVSWQMSFFFLCVALSESLSVCRLSVSACLSVCRSSLTLFALYKDIPALSEVPAAASSGTPAQPAAAAAVDEPQPGDLESTSDCKQVPITEFDLESPKDCTEFILHAFGADHREEVRPVADFYVQKLRGQAHKGEPLAEIFY